MSTRHRSFTSEHSSEPVTFDVDGEEFTCIASLPSGILLDVAEGIIGNGNMNPAVLGEFFDAVIVEGDQERFAKLLRKPEGPNLDTLKEILKFLVEEYTGFPTQTSSGSQRLPGQTGAGSSGSLRSQGSTSKNSQRRKR